MSAPERAAGAPPVAVRESCRVVGGRVPLWPYHHARLRAAGCTSVTAEAAATLALQAAGEWTASASSRVRLSITVGTDGVASVDVRQRLSSLDVPGGPVAARVDVDAPPLLPPGAAKPADRSWWDEVQRRARLAGAHQGVAVRPDGVIIDGASASVWIVEGGGLITPASPPAVAGVARAFLMRAAPGANVRVAIEPVSWERFLAADEAFLTNAFGGAVAVRDRGDCVFRAVGAMFDEMWASAL